MRIVLDVREAILDFDQLQGEIFYDLKLGLKNTNNVTESVVGVSVTVIGYDSRLNTLTDFIEAMG